MTDNSEAYAAGYDVGKAAGSWVVGGNTTAEAARRMLTLDLEGDPEFWDAYPGSPLSGEWADGPTPASVLAELGVPEGSDVADEILSQWEDGHHDGWRDEVLRAANVIVPTCPGHVSALFPESGPMLCDGACLNPTEDY
jgi:hypothetical protein